MRLSFKECVRKGDILYNPISKVKVYLTSEGNKIIDQIKSSLGSYNFDDADKKFIKKLLNLGFLEFNNQFNDITKELNILGPETIEWELSRKCNLKCNYCFLKKYDYINEKDPLSYLNEILKIPFLEIIITGGEPLLLGNKLKEIIKLLRQNNKGVILYSNGGLINEDWINFIKEYNVGLFIGNDFITKNKNKSLNKKDILKIKKQGIDVGVNLVITKHNLNEAKELFMFCKRNKIPLRSNLVLDNTPLKPTQKESIVFFKEKIYNLDHIGCGAGSKTFYIRSDGKITPCALFLSDNFLKGTDNYEKIKDICNKKFPTLTLNFCKDCNLKFMCNSGCRARAYLEQGSIFSKDEIRCNLERTLILDLLKTEGYKLARKSFYQDYKEKVSQEFFKKGLLSTLNDWDNFIKDNFVLTKFINKKLIGFILFKIDINKKIGRVSFIVVDNRFRKKGIGTNLMSNFENICKICGMKKIMFGSTTKNPVNFYLNKGYKIIKTSDESGTKMNLLQKRIF